MLFATSSLCQHYFNTTVYTLMKKKKIEWQLVWWRSCKEWGKCTHRKYVFLVLYPSCMKIWHPTLWQWVHGHVNKKLKRPYRYKWNKKTRHAAISPPDFFVLFVKNQHPRVTKTQWWVLPYCCAQQCESAMTCINKLKCAAKYKIRPKPTIKNSALHCRW